MILNNSPATTRDRANRVRSARSQPRRSATGKQGAARATECAPRGRAFFSFAGSARHGSAISDEPNALFGGARGFAGARDDCRVVVFRDQVQLEYRRRCPRAVAIPFTRDLRTSVHPRGRRALLRLDLGRCIAVARMSPARARTTAAAIRAAHRTWLEQPAPPPRPDWAQPGLVRELNRLRVRSSTVVGLDDIRAVWTSRRRQAVLPQIVLGSLLVGTPAVIADPPGFCGSIGLALFATSLVIATALAAVFAAVKEQPIVRLALRHVTLSVDVAGGDDGARRLATRLARDAAAARGLTGR